MMRQLALTVTTALLAVGLVVSPVLAEQIQWAQNLDQARLLASQQNKLLLIHFWTPDCGPCKTIESKVFPTAMVAAAINRHFVPLKVNAYENEALRSHFDVRKWPTDVVSTVDGQQLSQMVTSQDPAKYVNKLMMIAGQNLNAKPAGMSQQTPNSLVSHPGAVHHATAQQQPQATQAQPTGTQLPNLQANSAMARRPGVDPAMRPGTGLHMQTPNFEATPSNLGAQMPGREPAANGVVSNPNVIANQPGLTNSPKRSRFDNDFAASPAPATPASQPMAAKPSEIPNRFTNTAGPGAGQPMQTAAGTLPGNVVSNPYATQNTPGSQFSTPGGGQQPTGMTPPSSSMAGTQSNVIENRFANGASPRQQPAARNRYDGPAANNAAAANNVAAAMAPGVGNRQPSAAANNVPSATPPTASLGLDGRCPVTLITQNKWVAGDKRWGAVHRGKTYLFAGPEQQREFLSAPDNFSPVLAGIDVVKLASAGRVIEGTRRYGVLFDDDGDDGPRQSRIYLFDSADSRNRFEAEPDTFLQPVMQAMQSGNLNSLIR